MALLPPIWTPGVDELDTFAGEMTKKRGVVKKESGKSVRKVNCKRRREIGPMTGCHVLHTKRPPQQFFTGKQSECFAQLMFQKRKLNSQDA